MLRSTRRTACAFLLVLGAFGFARLVPPDTNAPSRTPMPLALAEASTSSTDTLDGGDGDLSTAEPKDIEGGTSAPEPTVEAESTPFITNDVVVLGILFAILAFVFKTSSIQTGFWRRFYSIVPSLLLCYFLPSLLRTAKIIDPAVSALDEIAMAYFLPASLILLTLSADLPGVLRLGPKAVILFLTGTVGVIIGGPLAILIVSVFSPEVVGGAGPEAVWRGMTTVAGSWIGGGVNQAAMKEVFEVSDRVFSSMVAVDVLVANVWMAILLLLANRSAAIDKRMGANTQAIDALKERIVAYQATVSRIPSTGDLMLVVAVAFVLTAASTLGGAAISERIAALGIGWMETASLTSSMLWLVLLATTFGVALSFTRVRNLEGVGASKVGSVFLYFLVATIGMKMDLAAVTEEPGLFAVGGIWIAIHAGLMVGMTIILRAPIFFLAVGSQANIGGAASAPIVASVFHPTLAPVGVLLAVVGYVLGTYGAYVCGLIMQAVAPS